MKRVVMLYDGQCSLCVSSMLFVKRLDWRGRIDYQDARDWQAVSPRFPDLQQQAVLKQIHVIQPDGQVHVGFEGVRVLVRYLPPVAWLYPLLYLPGAAWFGHRIYAFVARNRYLLSRVFAPLQCTSAACREHFK